jgi:hypothetical protein
MNNFTQLHLGNKKEKPQSAPSLSKEKALFGAGLLAVTVLSGVFLLITNGCSKSRTKIAPETSTNQNPITPPSTPNSAPVANTVLPPKQDVKPVHKRAVQRKAPTSAYSDPISGISFRYPKSYILKTGDEPSRDLAGLGPVKLDFVQPGGITVAAVEVPYKAYPGTDFSSAYFSVSVHPELSAAQCEQFVSAELANPESESALPTKSKIAGAEFTMVEDMGGENHDVRTRYYHRFENSACYEFGMGLATDDTNMAGLNPVNRDQVFRKLEQILASVKLQPGVVPEVAKGAQDHPIVEGGKE